MHAMEVALLSKKYTTLPFILLLIVLATQGARYYWKIGTNPAVAVSRPTYSFCGSDVTTTT